MHRTNRRGFLSAVAGGLAAGTLRTGVDAPTTHDRLAALSARAASQDDEGFWQLVQREFPVRPGLIMMNAANLCPSPYVVIDAVTRLTADIDADASFQNRAKFAEMQERARTKLAAYAGADPDEIAIVRNTSEANNTVVNGVTLGRGDEVLLWDQNHPTNNVSWDVRAERAGFTVRRIPMPAAPRTMDDLLNAVSDAVSPRTKMLAFSHISNVSGIAMPARDICRFARSRGIMTLVDGAQSFGAVRIGLHDLGCDFFTSSSHKWFIGPKEAGILYVRADRIADLWASDVGVGWQSAVENGARKFENLGQRDDACVAAMEVAVDFHNTVGPRRIEARVRALATAVIEQLRERVPSMQFPTPLNPELRAGIAIFAAPDVEGRTLFSRLYEEHGVAGAPRGVGVRLSPHIYNTMADVERAVEAVAALV